MLASRVAHASAKGRSRESGYRAIVWVYLKVAAKTFRAPSRRYCLIRSRPASTICEMLELCTRATFWGFPSLPTTKARAAGFSGRIRIAPTSNGMSGEASLANVFAWRAWHARDSGPWGSNGKEAINARVNLLKVATRTGERWESMG
jgi:hypothetical protein